MRRDAGGRGRVYIIIYTCIIVGERERANLVVRLARFFYIYIYIIYIYIIYILYWDGAHRSCAHARKLRETPTRH